MEFHHIGLAVENIKDYYNKYLKLFGFNELTPIKILETQKVQIAYAINASGVKIELIEALDETSPSTKVLKRKNGGLYHLGFTSQEFMKDVELLKNRGFRVISLGEDVAFLLAPTMELYEIIED
ncbi:VOC family protein [Paenibacillus motobuensis]|uniref:Methylmalonyl-CoA epimerase n=1 Tax=Paenibacillus motobuensis TaxID=295324 RepID=A0ABN0XX87_9BACL